VDTLQDVGVKLLGTETWRRKSSYSAMGRRSRRPHTAAAILSRFSPAIRMSSMILACLRSAHWMPKTHHCRCTLRTVRQTVREVVRKASRVIRVSCLTYPTGLWSFLGLAHARLDRRLVVARFLVKRLITLADVVTSTSGQLKQRLVPDSSLVSQRRDILPAFRAEACRKSGRGAALRRSFKVSSR
jgi:hypothetical protein